MDATIMNSKNNKTSDPHRPILNLTDKINKRSDKYVVLWNPNIYYTWKKIKNSDKCKKK